MLAEENLESEEPKHWKEGTAEECLQRKKLYGRNVSFETPKTSEQDPGPKKEQNALIFCPSGESCHKSGNNEEPGFSRAERRDKHEP